MTSKADSQDNQLYYGCVIVAVMAAAGAVSMAMGSLNYGLFIKPMGDELGIGRSTFGWAQTARLSPAPGPARASAGCWTALAPG